MDEKPKALKDALKKLKQLAAGRLGDVTQAKVVESFNEVMAAREGMPPLPPERLAQATEQVRYLMQRHHAQTQASAAAGLDRRPTDHRNGRPVSTEALDEETLQSGSVEILIDRFADLATALHVCGEQGQLGRTYRLRKRMAPIVEALQTRGPDGRSALLSLLPDRNPGVRYYAAQACLSFAPAEADRALETLTRDSAGDIGSQAQMGLAFRRGPYGTKTDA
jgi:hypothetical protein